MAEEREVELTNLDQPLFDGAEATKRDLVTYLEAVQEPLLNGLRGRPLSVMRALRGRRPFMQKNVPRYLPEWVRTATIWAEASRRDVTYALCDDWPTLKWFANQRAIEYHPALVRIDAEPPRQTHLVLDLDPPEGAPFAAVVAVAELVRQALAEAGLSGALKTSGAKGVHILVPIAQPASGEQIAAATRALAARAERLDRSLATTAYVLAERGGRVFVDATRAYGATIAAAYSPRLRPGATVSFPLAWDALADADPHEFTIKTVPALLDGGDPWAALLPAPQPLPAELVEEGREIPVARVAAMHEGKRRARARREAAADAPARDA
ncbi:ATP-dependent DNA ligase [Conexibacter sp. JD483]|uniref:DNA polymerase domain-containing protein n=1 Tax=unclassified Conexibacter TaxID=2627773 RepID=UPI00271BCDB5|nr:MULTISPECIES: ATP-dependent DNA ligase [unclassified Conexibacter]MDO8184742.1 ATP-dependent DNA ligase [Conexibacter sp. CPCC 205706]MDO8196517.1 ATP-dependent DNA ligase [Conexibacter sp. CPCC 205762]MDR9369003.1 ATP-dependent DNA ligase [Conexibacter sp. JD483]